MALLGWSELRNGVAEHVPADCIHLGKRFSHLQQFDDHVQLSFADGESVDAKVLVGADGTFSKIRQHTLADGLPTFAVSHGTMFCSNDHHAPWLHIASCILHIGGKAFQALHNIFMIHTLISPRMAYCMVFIVYGDSLHATVLCTTFQI